MHGTALRRMRRFRGVSRARLGVDQPECPRAQVETPSWLAIPEHDPGHACIRVIKPKIGDPGSDVVLVTGDPFRVAELAALQFDGQAVAAGQDDLDIASPPAIRGPGLHPDCKPLRLGPFPYLLLAFRMPQALRIVLSAGRGHPGWMSKVLLADAAVTALGHERDGPRAVWQIRTLVARQAHQGSVTVVTLLVPLFRTTVPGVDFTSGHQVQADHEQIRRHDASDDEHAAAGSERPRRMADKGLACQAGPVVGGQMFVREVPLKKEVPLGARARSCGDQK